MNAVNGFWVAQYKQYFLQGFGQVWSHTPLFGIIIRQIGFKFWVISTTVF